MLRNVLLYLILAVVLDVDRREAHYGFIVIFMYYYAYFLGHNTWIL